MSTQNKQNKITRINAQGKYSQEKVPIEVDRVTGGQKGSKIGKTGKKGLFGPIIDQKRLIKGFRLKIGKQN